MKFHAIKSESKLDELQEALKELGAPLLRVWWAPGASKWCAVLGIGVPEDKLRAEADVMGFASDRGLEIVCTAKESDLVGKGDTIGDAIYRAADLFFERYATRIMRRR